MNGEKGNCGKQRKHPRPAPALHFTILSLCKVNFGLKSRNRYWTALNLSFSELMAQLAMIKAIKISRKREIRRLVVWVGRDFDWVGWSFVHVFVDVYIWLQFRRLILRRFLASDRKIQVHMAPHVHQMQRASEMFYLFGPRSWTHSTRVKFWSEKGTKGIERRTN